VWGFVPVLHQLQARWTTGPSRRCARHCLTVSVPTAPPPVNSSAYADSGMMVGPVELPPLAWNHAAHTLYTDRAPDTSLPRLTDYDDVTGHNVLRQFTNYRDQVGFTTIG